MAADVPRDTPPDVLIVEATYGMQASSIGGQASSGLKLQCSRGHGS